MYNIGGSPSLTNVTFSGNSASVAGGGGILNHGGSLSLYNSILWGNTPDQIINGGSSTISYSLVQDGCPTGASCDANLLTGDPLFVDADGTDNTPGTLDDNLRLTLDSPAVDAGNNSFLPIGVITDLDGNPRISNATVDMGAYEFQTLNASFTATPVAGTLPLTVTFTDQSTGTPAPNSWAWTFGDGDTSNVQHPLHTYVTSSTFTVTLTVSNTVGSDTLVDVGCVTVSEAGQDVYLPVILKNQP